MAPGPLGVGHVRQLPGIAAGLLARGLSEDETVNVMGGNAMRVLRDVVG